jgi:hypothetical protein
MKVVGERVYKPTPSQDMPLSWQLTQPFEVLAWIMAPLGAGNLNPVLGTIAVATPGTSAAGVFCKWQLSHLELMGDGMCEFAPGVALGGNTTMLLIP